MTDFVNRHLSAVKCLSHLHLLISQFPFWSATPASCPGSLESCECPLLNNLPLKFCQGTKDVKDQFAARGCGRNHKKVSKLFGAQSTVVNVLQPYCNQASTG